MLHDPAHFPEPHAFRPERWLESEDDLHRYWVPFGRGSRSCLGQHFATAELYIAIAALVRRFDFELFEMDARRDMDPVRDCFLGEQSLQSKGLRVRIVGDAAAV